MTNKRTIGQGDSPAITASGLVDVKASMEQLQQQGISFDEAVIMLIKSHGLTWNAAADRLRGAEAITGIKLAEGGESREEFERDRMGQTGEDNARRLPNPPPEPQQEQEGALDAQQEATEETLHCTICQAAIDPVRARRQTSTCSEKCKNRLDVIRAHQRATKRCPYCLNPSTPEERAAFRVWRAERGDLRSATKVKRDFTLPSKTDMRFVMMRAIHALTEERDRLTAALDPNNVLGTKTEAMAGGLSDKQRKQAAARLETVTTLIRDCEASIAPKAPAA
jgi:predicted nucleic acid-binding Zn ribbon protein